MLIVAMADFVAHVAGKRRHGHGIVIDQPEIAAADQNIPVLKIAMSNIVLTEYSEQSHPSVHERGNRRHVADALFNVVSEILSFDPLHFQDRIPLPVDADTLFQKVK